MRICLRAAISMLFTAAVAQHAWPQNPATTFKVEVRMIEVYATIFDQKGHYVDGLTQDRFQVLENGKPQSVRSFESNSEGVACAVLLDTTGSMAQTLPVIKNAIVKLIDSLGANDQIAIYTFSTQLTTVQEFTADKSAAKRAVLRARAAGATALFDAMSQTAKIVSQRTGKKALIVFTDGQDNASVLNANAAVVRIKKAGIPLYIVAEGDALKSKSLMHNLEDIAERTGGTTHSAKGVKQIESIFDEISGELKHTYLLAYSADQPPDQAWRKIEVAVKGVKGYRIRAKEGYFPD